VRRLVCAAAVADADAGAVRCSLATQAMVPAKQLVDELKTKHKAKLTDPTVSQARRASVRRAFVLMLTATDAPGAGDL
jgi:hypothetical protein